MMGRLRYRQRGEVFIKLWVAIIEGILIEEIRLLSDKEIVRQDTCRLSSIIEALVLNHSNILLIIQIETIYNFNV